jgi:hypothetical protein
MPVFLCRSASAQVGAVTWYPDSVCETIRPTHMYTLSHARELKLENEQTLKKKDTGRARNRQTLP